MTAARAEAARELLQAHPQHRPAVRVTGGEVVLPRAV
jgi:hypothetical protein